MESSGIKKQYYVEGIDCANCAAKIEERVRGLNEIEEANLDFVFKKLTFQIKDGSEEKKVFNKVREIVKAVEPDVDLKEVESEQEDEGLKKKDNSHR